MSSGPTVQTLVNRLADRLGSPVILEDAEQQLVAYSPHYLADEMRQQTILRRTTALSTGIKVSGNVELASRPGPHVIPADPERARLARLCIPIRYLETVLGYAWVLLQDDHVDEATITRAAEVAEEISFTLLAESRTRASESDTVLATVSPDVSIRYQGLIDIETRGGFGAPRTFMAVVTTGPDWAEADTRGSFWMAGWSKAPEHQLRGTRSDEGIAVISVAPGDVDAVPSSLERAFTHITQQRDQPALAIGFGGLVDRVADLHESYRQARLAARAALSSLDLGHVVGWQQLGINRFLTQLPRDVLRDAVDPRLRELAEEEPIVLQTLDCYLRHAGGISAVAGALHIHRTTLYYRLARLREFGIEPASGTDRLAMGAGIAAMRLLGTFE